ncbi:MAG: hypothetical protein IKG82_13800 [Oscillospiraceae bacterium]|nr:hypothetical protein [Oscillospiraceae bacterium]MBR3419757.1 hypothetical protein [Oscillospiraceae bacterium]
MKLKELFAVTDGSVKFSVSETEKPLCKHDFWKTYGAKPEWEKEVRNAKLMPRSKDESGLWFDDVICLIMLK